MMAVLVLEWADSWLVRVVSGFGALAGWGVQGEFVLENKGIEE